MPRRDVAPLILGSRRDCVVGSIPWTLQLQGKSPGKHRMEGWVSPRAGLDALEKREGPAGDRITFPLTQSP
jgi:hypothetical protein